MKSLSWIILVLLVPFSATAQSQLYFHATIEMPVTGWHNPGYCSDDSSRPINSITVQLNDSLSLVAGENQDSLKSPMLNWGPNGVCSGNYTFQYDPQSHTLYNLQVSAAGHGDMDVSGWYDSYNISFAISLDSISLGAVSESNRTLAGGSWLCSYSSHYSSIFNGYSGGDNASGQGQTTLVTPTASTAGVKVSTGVPSSSVQITYLTNGAVEIERSSSNPSEAVEIFDALGHVALRTNMNGNVAQISNLIPGLYFAHIGEQVAKFIVSPR